MNNNNTIIVEDEIEKVLYTKYEEKNNVSAAREFLEKKTQYLEAMKEKLLTLDEFYVKHNSELRVNTDLLSTLEANGKFEDSAERILLTCQEIHNGLTKYDEELNKQMQLFPDILKKMSTIDENNAQVLLALQKRVDESHKAKQEKLEEAARVKQDGIVENERMKQEIKSLEKLNEQMLKSVIEAEPERDNLESILETSKSEVEILRNDHRKLEEELDGLLRDMQDFQKSYDSDFEKLQQTSAALKTELTNTNAEVKLLTNEWQENREVNSSLLDQIANLKTINADLLAEKANVQKNIQDTDEKIKILHENGSKEIAAKLSLIGELNDETFVEMDRKDQAENDLKFKKMQLNNLKTKLDNTKEEVSQLENQNTKILDETKTLDEANKILEDEFNTISITTKNQQEELTEKLLCIKQLEEEKHKLKSNADLQESTTLNKFHQQLHNKQQQLTDIETNNKSMQEEISNYIKLLNNSLMEQKQLDLELSTELAKQSQLAIEEQEIRTEIKQLSTKCNQMVKKAAMEKKPAAPKRRQVAKNSFSYMWESSEESAEDSKAWRNLRK